MIKFISGNSDHWDVVCDEFVRFCEVFGIEAPEPGELIKLTLKTASVQRLSSRKDVISRLRASKKYDVALMAEAVSWLETFETEDQVVSDSPDGY